MVVESGELDDNRATQASKQAVCNSTACADTGSDYESIAWRQRTVQKSLSAFLYLLAMSSQQDILRRLPTLHTPRQNRLCAVFARDSIYAKRAYAIAIPSVCPSVCLSHGWISQKRLKLGSCNFHHTVAPSL